MNTKKQRQRRRDDARLTESGNTRSEQLNTRGVYRVANQQSLACLSGSERWRPGWILEMKYQTCFPISSMFSCLVEIRTSWIAEDTAFLFWFLNKTFIYLSEVMLQDLYMYTARKPTHKYSSQHYTTVCQYCHLVVKCSIQHKVQQLVSHNVIKFQ